MSSFPQLLSWPRNQKEGPVLPGRVATGVGFGVKGAMPWNAHGSMDPFQGLSNPFTQ